jgi:hypothetical protein
VSPTEGGFTHRKSPVPLKSGLPNLPQLDPRSFGDYLEQKSGHWSNGIKPGNCPHFTILKRAAGASTMEHRKTDQ